MVFVTSLPIFKNLWAEVSKIQENDISISLDDLVRIIQAIIKIDEDLLLAEGDGDLKSTNSSLVNRNQND